MRRGVLPGYFSQVLTDGKGRSVYTAVNTYPNDLEPVRKEARRSRSTTSRSRPPSLDQIAKASFHQVTR